METDKPHSDQRGFDGRGLVQHFHGPANLAALARKHGVGITNEQAKKWQQRGTVPASGLALLVELGRLVGLPVNLTKFMRSESRG
jgi:hypothetical protein